MNKENLPYRPCAGVILVNRDGLIFAGKRIDNPNDYLQAPQGGVDPGETPEEAARRELKEEIGTDHAEILRSYPGTLLYDVPPELLGKVWDGKYRGQEQYWFLAHFLGTDSDIDIHGVERPEFRACLWTDAGTLYDRVVPFKKEVYRKVLKEFELL